MNMVYSCSVNESKRNLVPAEYYKRNEYGGFSFKVTAPLHDLSMKKVEGPVVFVADSDGFWGGDGSKSYCSKVIEKPTFRSLWGAAKSSMKKTKDYHHSFIEGCVVSGNELIDGREVKIVRFVLGS